MFLLCVSQTILTWAYSVDSGFNNYAYVWIILSIATTIIVDIINIKRILIKHKIASKRNEIM